MGVVDRLETLCAAERHEQARDLATGIVQRDTVVGVELSGAGPDAAGATVVHVETDHFRGRHVLSDRSEQGTGWPGRYTVKGADAAEGFGFGTATMPAEAERLVEDRFDVEQRRSTLPEWARTESEEEVTAND